MTRSVKDPSLCTEHCARNFRVAQKEQLNFVIWREHRPVHYLVQFKDIVIIIIFTLGSKDPEG